MSIFYYGGKFNPVTRGHLHVVREVLESSTFSDDDELHIGVLKPDGFPYVGGLVELVELAVADEFPEFRDRIAVIPQDEDRTWQFLQSRYGGKRDDNDIVLIMGSDRYSEFTASLNAERDGSTQGNAWANATEIDKRCDAILAYDRLDGVSSSKVRDVLLRDPYADYDKVRDLLTKPVFDWIKENRCYGQLGYEDDYRKAESQFLATYDMTVFPRPSVTVDGIVTRTAATGGNDLEILLVRRAGMPYKGFWALPGGFLDIGTDRSLEDAAARELFEETGIRCGGTLRQFRTYGDMGVDPRGRVVDVVFHTHMSFGLTATLAGDDALEVRWFNPHDLPRMAFNHRRIVEDFMKGGQSDGR